ncbi:MAG TPA: hypothetical protein VG225_04940 [Terracidiphilus sp.]|nr:hypothetical protein [Terracidiphilus sp.]
MILAPAEWRAEGTAALGEFSVSVEGKRASADPVIALREIVPREAAQKAAGGQCFFSLN